MKITNFAELSRRLSPEVFIKPNGISVKDGISCSTGCPAAEWCRKHRQGIERMTCAYRFLAWANAPYKKENA